MPQITHQPSFRLCVLSAVLALALGLPQMAQAGTVQQIQERGVLRCGANPTANFAEFKGNQWGGFFAEFCRAVAAAVLGNADAIEVTRTEAATRFDAMHNDAIDLLVDGATWTLGRDAGMGLFFPGIYLYDGQGFLVRKTMGVNRLADLRDARICVIRETTTLANLEQYIAGPGKDRNLSILTVNSDDGAWTSFLKDRCNAITNDRIGLNIRLQTFTPDPSQYVMLPDVISKEPLGPVVLDKDVVWAELVHWVLNVMISAEELGISQSNIATATAGDEHDRKVILGEADDQAKAFGIKPGWARRVIEQVGNYADIYDRSIGSGSVVKLDRGINALWTQGGLLYGRPLR